MIYINTQELVKSILTKFENIDTKIENMIKNYKSSKKLLKEIDFIEQIGLNVSEYDLLTNYQNVGDLKEAQIKQLIKCNDLLEQKFKYIDLINEAIILENSNNYKVVNKNSIHYILNKKKDKQEKQNVIINVYLNTQEEDKQITLDKILNKEGKDNEK